MNLVTTKVSAKLELLFNKPAFGYVDEGLIVDVLEAYKARLLNI